MRIKVVLFDLDGTLIDSAEDIGLALRKTLRDIGLEELYPEDVRKYVGGGAKALLEKVLGDKFREEYVEIFREHYLSNPVVYTKPYEGIVEVLKELKERSVKLAVVTNKLEDISREILKRLGLLEYFEFIAGGDTFPEKKPSPLPVLKSLEKLNEEPAKALVVGDTEADILAGKAVGTKTALASWGYVKLNSVKPDHTLKKPEEILEVLDSFCNP